MIALRKNREKLKLTQEHLAQYCGVDRATVSKWETGEYMPRADKLPKLAKLLNCTVDDLLRKDE